MIGTVKERVKVRKHVDIAEGSHLASRIRGFRVASGHAYGTPSSEIPFTGIRKLSVDASLLR